MEATKKISNAVANSNNNICSISPQDILKAVTNINNNIPNIIPQDIQKAVANYTEKSGTESTVTSENQLEIPLLEDEQIVEKPKKTPAQKVIRKTFKKTALLSNLLPSGSVLAFQILSPVVTHEGQCLSSISHSMTLFLLGICGISCFCLCFTDSFRDERGKVRYGLATFRGLWTIDGSCPPEDAEKYKLKFLDFFHALLSILCFGAVAAFDQNVLKCLYPSPSPDAQEILAMLPMAVGLVCTLMFVAFPTTRHGIGFPLSRC
ncbi:putative myb-like protein X-like [Capsicum annuum]|uniref:protein DMP7-like n=1 Tax=Capsicum annuum TaxID=4072 RepID=UPI0007BF748A|nr:protein DMP7-like [Capsicum annuum]KAF3657347.1 putative myb-like protein X-like [Capsicum annuum]